MLRVSDLIDLPIKTLSQDRSRSCTIKSILIDGINNKVAAVVCKESAMKKHCKVIPYRNIISIDMNGVVIARANMIMKLTAKDRNNFIQLDAIRNKMVKSSTGDLQGMITDIYINPLNGKIIGYELSEGYIDDFFNGRKMINISENLKNSVGKEEITLYQRLY